MPLPNPPLLAHLHFSPKEAASLFGLVRWMGTLGRLQVLGGTAGTFGAIAVIGITYALDTESAQDSANVMPLIQLGQIERSVIVIAMALLAFLSALVLRSGILLVDASEELEEHLMGEHKGSPHLRRAFEALATSLFLDALVLGGLAGMAFWLAFGDPT